jgi:hypothetical protein
MLIRITTGISVQTTSACVLCSSVRAATAPFDFPELQDRGDHRAEHDDRDRHAHPEQQHLQLVRPARDRRDADRQVIADLVRARRHGAEQTRCGGKRALEHPRSSARALARRASRPGQDRCRGRWRAIARAGDPLVGRAGREV